MKIARTHLPDEPVLLACLWDMMQKDLQAYDYIQADETPVQVLHEKDRTAKQKSYMWLFQGDPPKKRIILYHYAPTRAATVPDEILGDGFRGYLQTDGYAWLPCHLCSRWRDWLGLHGTRTT